MLKLKISPPQQEPFDMALEDIAPESGTRDEIIIGRSQNCDISVNDRFMSRQQARLFRVDGAWRIEDLGSRNGTLLNGRPLASAVPVRVGDQIRISNTTLDLHGPDGAASKAPVTSFDSSGSHTVFHQASDLLSASHLSAGSEPTLVELQEHADRLRILNDVHQALARSLSSRELLEMILERIFDFLEPEEGVIVVRKPDGELAPAAHRVAPGHKLEYSVSETLIREVVEKESAALVLDIAEDERFAGSHSIVSSGVRSLIAAPLGSPDGPLGMIAVNSRLSRRQFTEADLELLTSVAAVAGLHLRNLALTEEAAERRRLEAEVAFAREIQVALLPDELPTLPGYELFAGTVPSQGVSGDFYEILHQEAAGRCALAIVDVSGKGIGASLLTASIEALLAVPIEQNQAPGEICESVSRLLYERTPAAKYATMILCALDLETGVVRYANAGHNQAIVIRTDGSVERIESTGPPIGLLPIAAYEPAELRLGRGDMLVLYTDGITEAENPAGEEFGLERLEQTCLDAAGRDPEALASAVNATLDRFVDGVPFADDRTIVVLRHKGE